MEINSIIINFPWEFLDPPGLTASRLDQSILPLSRLSKSRFTGSRLDRFLNYRIETRSVFVDDVTSYRKAAADCKYMLYSTAAHLQAGKNP